MPWFATLVHRYQGKKMLVFLVGTSAVLYIWNHLMEVPLEKGDAVTLTCFAMLSVAIVAAGKCIGQGIGDQNLKR